MFRGERLTKWSDHSPPVPNRLRSRLCGWNRCQTEGLNVSLSFAVKPASPQLTFAIICCKSPVDRCKGVQLAWPLDLHELAFSCTSRHGQPLPGQIRIPSLARIPRRAFSPHRRFAAVLQQMPISRAVVESGAPDRAPQAPKKQPDHSEADGQIPALDLYATYED